MKLAPIEAAPPTLVSLPPAAAPPIRAMVAAVVTIDTVFEMIFPASLCPTILEDSQKQLSSSFY